MPTILLNFFLLYNLLNSFLLSMIPKKLRSLWPPHTCTHHTNPTLNSNPLTSSPPPPSFHSHKRSSMDSTELYNVFQVFDRNGDGLITKEELNDSLENMGIFIPLSDLSLMIQKIDANGDGCVDVAEFRELHRSIMEERDDGGGDQEEDMKEAFDVFDRNGDGFITGDELRSVLESLGVKQGRTLEDCKRMIKKVDVDGDGRVNFVEFKEMMKGDGISALS